MDGQMEEMKEETQMERGVTDRSRFRDMRRSRRRSHSARREVTVLQGRLHSLPVCREHPEDTAGTQRHTVRGGTTENITLMDSPPFN